MDAHHLIATLERQLVEYQMLLKLCAVQHQFVVNDNTDGLMKLLERRATVLATITQLEAELRPAKLDWPNFSAGLSDATRQHAERLFGDLRALLQQITAADNDDALVLQQRKLSVGRQLAQTRVGKSMQRGYATASYAQNKRVDVSR